MPDTPPGGAKPRPTPKVLRCPQCGRAVACTDDQLLAYALAGWPLCCGETMVLQAGEPGPRDAPGGQEPPP